MAPKSKRRNRANGPDRHGALLVVCRGGDCGSRIKHPDVDHRQQLDEFKRRRGRAVVVSRCLDACDYSNVVVIVPSSDDEARGAEPIWIGEVNDGETVGDVIACSEDSSRDVSELLQIKRFRPTRRNRHELEVELPG